MRYERVIVSLAFWLLASIACIPRCEAAEVREGFGGLSKLRTTVTKVSPPPIFVLNPTFQVESGDQNSEYQGIAKTLQARVEGLLLRRGCRLRFGSDQPETLIQISIIERIGNEDWETTKEQAREPKTSPTEHGDSAVIRYKIVEYVLRVYYKILDISSRSVLDADSLSWEANKGYQLGLDPQGLYSVEAQSLYSVEDDAISSIAESIANRISSFRENISVLVPRGSLDDLSRLATSGNWNRYLDALQDRKPSPDPVAESYRQYAIGLANEALGYAEESPITALVYLEEAAARYNAALEANPAEKFFIEGYSPFLSPGPKVSAPLDRVRSALVGYQIAKKFMLLRESTKTIHDSKGPVPEGEPDEALDNQGIMRMVEAGLSEEIIMTAIDNAPLREFDDSARGLIQLHKAKVGAKIIAKIQQIEKEKKRKRAEGGPR